MKVLIAGNGIAGTMAAKALREYDQAVAIEIFAEEKYPYYPRPNLIEFLAGRLPYEKLFGFPAEWAGRLRIAIHYENPVVRIRPEEQAVEAKDGRRHAYDALLLCNGASAFIPPVKGAEKKGVFTLRTLDDALRILDELGEGKKTAVIGGGLLGLELARALRTRGAEVEVIEFFDRLLPRQLDKQGASLLLSQLEKMGIRVHLKSATEEILGGEKVSGIRLKDGSSLEAEMLVVAAGVRPNLGLAKEAGLAVDRGVLVDDFLQTSHPKIFAAGDNVQHNGRVYGIIPASFDQARIAAMNVLGTPKKYEGTVVSNTLKIAGLYVTSIGLVNPEGEGYEEVSRIKEEEGLYKKIVLQEGKLVGVIWMGTKKGINELNRVVNLKKDMNRWKDALLEEDFDFSLL